MIQYFKFRQELFDPQPAQDFYRRPGPGKGWPEECPPLRAAAAFGFDILANFDITFIQSKGKTPPWRVEPDIVIASDFAYTADDQSPGAPLTQQFAWFWQKGQTLPHVISDNVYKEVNNQVKISSFLFLKTDPNELLFMTDIPNLHRPYRAMTALIETDWYPASYPWHLVLELDRSEKRIRIKKGEPLCRIIPVRRDTYFAQPMSPSDFSAFFDRGQKWLSTHGTVAHEAEGTVDIRHTYVRQQARPKFITLT